MIQMDQLSLSVISTRFQCPSCGFISIDHALLNPARSCPGCEASGEVRRAYPGLSASQLLKMIEHFYKLAALPRQNELSVLATQISQVIGHGISEKAAYKGWIEINRVFSKSRSYEDVTDRIKRFFRCEESQAVSVLTIYMIQDTHAPESPVVPILVVALIEILFNDLLVNLKVKYHKVSILEAQQEIRGLRSFEERYEAFADITGKDFDKTIQQISKPFWDKWKYVRRKRNFFVHGNPFALGWEACERAFKLASESTGIFAELNNLLAVRK